MASKGHSISNAQGFFLKYETEIESREELNRYIKDKLEIMADFLPRVKATEMNRIEQHLKSLNSKRSIDVYCKNYINSSL